MRGCIAGTQYFPSVEYYAHWHHHGHLTLEACEHYQKRSWRNKTAILGASVPIPLTIPLRKGKHQQMRITDVLISYDEPWPHIHLESFKSVYGKSPFFDEVLPALEEIFQYPYETLWALNLSCYEKVSSLLKGEWLLNCSTEYQKVYPSSITDLRAGIPAGKGLSPAHHPLSYAQVQRIGKPHQANLCILDALCHLGPETTEYLSRYAQVLYSVDQ